MNLPCHLLPLLVRPYVRIQHGLLLFFSAWELEHFTTVLLKSAPLGFEVVLECSTEHSVVTNDGISRRPSNIKLLETSVKFWLIISETDDSTSPQQVRKM